MKALREAQGASGSSWRKRLGAMVSGTRTVRSLLTAARMKRHDTSKVVFDEGAALWQQGDESLYTDDAVRKRAAVRHHPEVLEFLQIWWMTALNSIKSSGQAADAAAEPALNKQQYVSMMKKMYRVMIEDYDDDDATECAEEDWDKDAHGGAELKREAFCDAIFELADIWTKTCEAHEYVDFLRSLHALIAIRVDGTSYLWKEDGQIAFDPRFDAEALESPERVTPSPRRSLSPGRQGSARRSAQKRAAAGRGFGASGQHWQRLSSREEDPRTSVAST